MARWYVSASAWPLQSLVVTFRNSGSFTATDGSGICVQNSSGFSRCSFTKRSAIGWVKLFQYMARRLLWVIVRSTR